MQAVYEIPIIPNNLRNEETIVQIADALSYLCNVFDDIISKVNIRIDENKTYLNNLTERINHSAEKISKLKGTKKATQVFSSSKYPATDIHRKYKSIFTNTNKQKVKLIRTKIKFKNQTLNDQPLEKLQYYHVKISNKLKNQNKSVGLEEGLGSVPRNIELINELLLFNTSKNPYRNYIMSDPLQSIQYTRENDELTTSGPDAAPLSISQRAVLNRSIGENYFYSPGLGDVPTIDVPLDLPDLPGVADDLRYIIESDPAIAPSVTTTPIVPELPSIVQSPNEVPVSLSVPNPVNETLNLTETIPLPPLPPPAIIQTASTDNVTENKSANLPPVEQPVQPIAKSVKTKVKKTLPVVEDARASLMAAIRQAGGAKNANLRNTLPKKEEKDKSITSGNLMADLNAKLTLRRKGISGTKMSDGSDINSALCRISAMIPPPPPKSNELNESTNTEDEDWDE